MRTQALTPAVSRPAGAFLDRDGVINVDTGYPHQPEALELIDGALEAIEALNRAGYVVVVVSNQSGVARGYFGTEDVERFHEAIQARLSAVGAHIDAFYYCPYHPQAAIPAFRAEHPDRKPGAGMIEKAIRQFDLDRKRSFMIGDRISDIEAARNARIPGFLFSGPDLYRFIQTLDVLPRDTIKDRE